MTIAQFAEYLDEHYKSSAATRSEVRTPYRTMHTYFTIGGHCARTLLDTGSSAVNLISASFVQNNNLPDNKYDEPITVRMVAKGSTTMAKSYVDTYVLVGTSKVKTRFDVISMISQDAIVGMPFLMDTGAVLNPSEP